MRKRLGIVATIAALCLGPGVWPGPDLPFGTARAQGMTEAVNPVDRAVALAGLMRMDEILDVMAEEGRAYGDELEASLFPGQGGARWSATVAAIYEPANMRERFDAAFAAAIGGDEAALMAAEEFFASELGQRVLGLEIDARRALLDPDITEAAEVEADKLRAARDPRLRLVQRMIKAGDLIELNVAGGLTASLAFTRGLSQTLPQGQTQPDADLAADAWGEEAVLRADTSSRLISYMVMAYGPLTDAEFSLYVDFWETAEGRSLNTALFAGFDTLFPQISHDLGRATGIAMQGTDI